jgi:uncharacterized protein YkwD
MKTLATLIFIFVTFILSAQTSLDKKVFNNINEYRDSLCLPKLEWDSCAYKASEYQSIYLKSANGVVGHSNTNKGFEDLEDRYEKANGKKTLLLGEICNATNKNYKVIDTLVEEKLAIEIISLWKKSPDHNAIMLEPRMKYVGCSTKITTSSTGIKTYTPYDAYSVMGLFE